MLDLIEQYFLYLIMVGFVITFACGYAVRDWISRRRHAAERELFYKKHPELHPDVKR